MSDKNKFQTSDPRLLLGGALIVLGILFLLGQLFDFSLGYYLWPFYIIVPGVLLFALALKEQGSASEHPLMVIGSIVTMVGLILFYQNSSGHWESWAYAWALVGPTSIGLGQMLYGKLKGREELVQSGTHLATVGGVIFLAGLVFFELIIGLGNVGGIGWPAVLIILGVVLLLRKYLPQR